MYNGLCVGEHVCLCECSCARVCVGVCMLIRWRLFAVPPYIILSRCELPVTDNSLSENTVTSWTCTSNPTAGNVSFYCSFYSVLHLGIWLLHSVLYWLTKQSSFKLFYFSLLFQTWMQNTLWPWSWLCRVRHKYQCDLKNCSVWIGFFNWSLTTLWPCKK